ncbi:Abi-like protein [Rathayibacter sp. PhB185]|uniref:Abi family protein n=1 Tax=Rathayibacter sp. PhB186 TaxID=2485199 RepID=UPI000F4C609C|nr:Abi family protein [Rathayibacter sp. PhB186]MCJ1702632.1 Abi family protein [Rathayibacter sp. VKM Ac-2926]ROP56691.1 Abi-like protein [Rathayibacter sp. PhB186]ROS55076.1 Abi-like protein [Rathayibacter sp. PhB185]
MPSSAESWIVDWLTVERLAKYVRAAGGDHSRALAFYEWNARLSAELLHDLGHLEVGLRNAYDRALLAHPGIRGGDWIEQASFEQLLPVHRSLDSHGVPQDKNATPRAAIKTARRYARYTAGGRTPRGKVIAELMFGFWTYLSDGLHEKTLWVPALNRAYRPGTDRVKIHAALTDLRDVRNRLAHNESVFDRRPENIRRSLVFVARSLSPDLRDQILSTSRASDAISARP